MPRAVSVSISRCTSPGHHTSQEEMRFEHRLLAAGIRSVSTLNAQHPDEHSLSGAEFRQARNFAPARNLKPVPVMSNETAN